MNAPMADPESALGPLVREHRLRWSFTVAVVMVGSLFILVSLFGLGRAGYKAVTEGSTDDLTIAASASSFFLIVGALVLLWGIVRMARVVRLHHGGFLYKDRKGERAVPWRDIDGVYQKILRVYQLGVEIDNQDVYTILLRDGTRIRVDFSFADIDQFGAAVTAAVTEGLLPWCREAFRAGRPLDFGPVQIDGNGVYAQGKMLPWAEVQGISWKQGILVSDRAFLQIRRVGGLLAWAKLPIEDIKNYPVLIALAADIGKAE